MKSINVQIVNGDGGELASYWGAGMLEHVTECAQRAANDAEQQAFFIYDDEEYYVDPE